MIRQPMWRLKSKRHSSRIIETRDPRMRSIVRRTSPSAAMHITIDSCQLSLCAGATWDGNIDNFSKSLSHVVQLYVYKVVFALIAEYDISLLLVSCFWF